MKITFQKHKMADGCQGLGIMTMENADRTCYPAKKFLLFAVYFLRWSFAVKLTREVYGKMKA